MYLVYWEPVCDCTRELYKCNDSLQQFKSQFQCYLSKWKDLVRLLGWELTSWLKAAELSDWQPELMLVWGEAPTTTNSWLLVKEKKSDLMMGGIGYTAPTVKGINREVCNNDKAWHTGRQTCGRGQTGRWGVHSGVFQSSFSWLEAGHFSPIVVKENFFGSNQIIWTFQSI